MIGIGIDFGTSNSAVAWYDGQDVHCLHLEPGRDTMPTAVHIDREFQSLVGTKAVQKYVSENRARRVEITAKPIGEAAFDVRESLEGEPQGEEGGRQMLYGPSEDHGLPGRLFLGIKRLLGEVGLERIDIFSRPFRLVALVTPVFLVFREAIGAIPARDDRRVYVGRPVEFEGSDEQSNRKAVERLVEASRHARLPADGLYPEPLAACLSFLHQRSEQGDCRVLTVDFGGGTLDLSLVDWSGGDFRVLDTEGAGIGGDHIDQLIYQALVFPELGRGLSWTRQGADKEVTTEFPFHLYEKKLLNWAVTHTLNQNEYTARLHEYISEGGPDVHKIRRLRDVIVNNESHDILQSIKEAKARLSEVESTRLEIPEIDLSIPFSRTRLNSIINEVTGELERRVTVLLSRNGVDPAQVDHVVRTGGSCKLRAVVDLLEKQFPGKVVEHDIFTGVACGLAIASYHGYEYHPNRETP